MIFRRIYRVVLVFGTNSQFRAGMVVIFVMIRVLVPNHQGRPVYSVTLVVRHKVLLTRLGMFHHPAWAVGSYSSGPPAGGTPQI